MTNGTFSAVGSVVSLWRYPVKSMMGEELNALDVTDRGVWGDRALALVDATDGKVASAKNPRKWPGLFQYRATFVEPSEPGQPLPPVRIMLPDGTLVTSDQGDVNAVLSAALGRQVTLEGSPPAEPRLEEYWPPIEGLDHQDEVTDEAIPAGTFFDGAAIHLLTTATLEALRRAYPDGRFEVRRFRPNIVVAPSEAEAGFVENAWIGHTLAIGEQVQLKVTGPCPRCVMTTLAQGDLPEDRGILRAAAKANQAHVGLYAQVVRGGRVHCGDSVRLES